MRIITRKALKDFQRSHADASGAIDSWVARVSVADWTCLQDVVRDFPKAKTLAPDRARFEIRSGYYRLVVRIYFPGKIVQIKFIGTHAEYDRIDPMTVDEFRSRT